MMWRVALGIFAAGVLAGADDDGIRWFDNYKDAIAEAKRTGKPIFLEYRCEP